jgi:hypothetical protein
MAKGHAASGGLLLRSSASPCPAPLQLPPQAVGLDPAHLADLEASSPARGGAGPCGLKVIGGVGSLLL